MEVNTSRAEAERLLGIAEKLLQGKDLNGSKDFAILAQETEPLLDGSDQILAVIDVLIAAEKRINKHHDWYAILQLDRRLDDLELIKKQYRRLALLLHPDKNKFAFSDTAFKLVADAWTVLSSPSKKSMYDNEFGRFSKIDLVAMKKQRDLDFQQQHQDPSSFQHKLPVRRNSDIPNSSGSGAPRLSSFWTACPYCYNLYEYPRVYEGCCLRCQNCERAIHATEIPSLPPLVPGKDAFYCCWGFFPMGFVGGKNVPAVAAPGLGTNGGAAAGVGTNGGAAGEGGEGFVAVSARKVSTAQPGSRPRGRPRKNVNV